MDLHYKKKKDVLKPLPQQASIEGNQTLPFLPVEVNNNGLLRIYTGM